MARERMAASQFRDSVNEDGQEPPEYDIPGILSGLRVTINRLRNELINPLTRAEAKANFSKSINLHLGQLSRAVIEGHNAKSINDAQYTASMGALEKIREFLVREIPAAPSAAPAVPSSQELLPEMPSPAPISAPTEHPAREEQHREDSHLPHPENYYASSYNSLANEEWYLGIFQAGEIGNKVSEPEITSRGNFSSRSDCRYAENFINRLFIQSFKLDANPDARELQDSNIRIKYNGHIFVMLEKRGRLGKLSSLGYTVTGTDPRGGVYYYFYVKSSYNALFNVVNTFRENYKNIDEFAKAAFELGTRNSNKFRVPQIELTGYSKGIHFLYTDSLAPAAPESKGQAAPGGKLNAVKAPKASKAAGKPGIIRRFFQIDRLHSEWKLVKEHFARRMKGE